MTVISFNKQQRMSFGTARSQTTAVALLDWKLLGVIVCLVAIGLVMVTSASISIAERQYHDALYFMYRQSWYLLAGGVLAITLWRIPLEWWERSGPVLIITSIVLLVMTLLPGIGREVNGSVRWIRLGPINIQTSEFVKLATVIYLSGYLVRHNESVRNYLGGFVRPLALFSLVAFLILLQPDYGAVAVMMLTAMGMLWLGGARLLQFIFLAVMMAVLLTILAVLSPYRMERLTAFLNPWADPFNSGFQLTQSLIAFGRGEWFGVGLGESVQKLFYLPEAHTDFVFAVMAEELGLFFAILVVLMFAYVMLKAMSIGRQAEKLNKPFAAYLSYGIGIWIGLQAFINIGVNMGILPTKGLTLPLMSYGGSSLIIMLVAVMLLLRADCEVRMSDLASTQVKKVW